jgi:peptide/nickel transport system substrate-binding protein
MNKTQKVLTSLGIVSGVAVTAAFAAVPANTFFYMTSSDIPTLDPAQNYDTASAAIIENLYDTLLAYKGKSTTELEGILATDWKESGGGKTYTFNLRKGVKFHSGNDMTCADAEYSLRRNVVVNGPDSGNWFMADAFFQQPVPATDYKDVTWAKISKAISCNSAGQLVLNLVGRDPALLSKLAFSGQAIVDKKWAVGLGEWDGTEKTFKEWAGKDLTDSALNKKPSGTGPYQLVKRDPNQLVAKAFDGYWGPKPKIENIVISLVKEIAARLEALKKGDADAVDTGPRASVIPQLEGVKGVVINDGLPDNVSSGIMMNQKISNPEVLGSGKLDGQGIPANFFSDLSVRRGFAYSFGYDQYVKEVLQGKGTVRTMALPDTFMGYDPKVKAFAYNPELAKASFQKAWGGQVWKNGFTIKARYRAGSTGSQLAMEILKKNVEALNPKFKIELTAKPWSDFLKDSATGKEAMILIGWAPDYNDPDNFLYTFYYSTGYYSPRLNFKDASMDKLLDQARATTDTAKRKVFYSLVGRRAAELVPFVIMPRPINFNTYREELKGVKDNYNPMLGGSTLGVGTYWKDLSK